jgi:hypothetical protein
MIREKKKIQNVKEKERNWTQKEKIDVKRVNAKETQKGQKGCLRSKY